MSLTDSHHHHCGQIPTMVGICHGGNKPLGRDDDVDHSDDHDDDYEDDGDSHSDNHDDGY